MLNVESLLSKITSETSSSSVWFVNDQHPTKAGLISTLLCSSWIKLVSEAGNGTVPRILLSSNLKDALTIFNKKINDIFVKIMKLEQLGVSPSSILYSSILIIMGFSTYYIAPLGFFLQDYSIFLYILNMVLIAMIIGLIFMLQLLVPTLQSWILSFIMLFTWKDRNIKFVVEKNLNGHSKRNIKTSIMFMIALSFIIFAGCTIKLVSNFIVSLSKNILGADILIMQRDAVDSLDQIKQYLENE
jgi:hypothetical protein